MSGQIGVNLSICLTDIPKELIKTAKNGKSYANLSAFISSEVGQFGDNGGITLPQTKEQREAKERKVYVGNTKVYWSDGGAIVANTGKPEESKVSEPADNDLPF